MPYRALVALFVSLLLALEGPPTARAADRPSVQEAAIVQIRVVEGDGAIYALGSRSGRPLTVQITDETGKPASGAAVSFRLPEEGPCPPRPGAG